jgi:hypothetical protein
MSEFARGVQHAIDELRRWRDEVDAEARKAHAAMSLSHWAGCEFKLLVIDEAIRVIDGTRKQHA